MITWKGSVVGPTKVWKTTLTEIPLDRISIASAFKTIWADFGVKIAPFYVAIEWNIIRVELIEELGRVRIYPYKFRDEALAIAGCEISIPSFEEFIRSNYAEETPKSDQELDEKMDEVAAGIVDAAEVNLCPVFSRLSIRIDVCCLGDDEPIVTRTIHKASKPSA